LADGERLSEFRGGFPCLKIADETAANMRPRRKLLLTKPQNLSANPNDFAQRGDVTDPSCSKLG
jgi:hypothetical protein